MRVCVCVCKTEITSTSSVVVVVATATTATSAARHHFSHFGIKGIKVNGTDEKRQEQHHQQLNTTTAATITVAHNNNKRSGARVLLLCASRAKCFDIEMLLFIDYLYSIICCDLYVERFFVRARCVLHITGGSAAALTCSHIRLGNGTGIRFVAKFHLFYAT